MDGETGKPVQLVCPICGNRLPLVIKPNSQITGLFLRCKKKKCRSVIEIKVTDGVQVGVF